MNEEPKAHDNSKFDRYLGEIVYGGIDGSVTTFAVVAGAAGAEMSSGIVIVLGLVNLIADGFSMSVGNFLSVRSTIHLYKRKRRREDWEIDHMRESEIQEIRDIYRAKGFTGKELEMVVDRITSDRMVWIDDMMKNELNMTMEERRPWMIGMATFLSFVVAGLIPLLAYILDRMVGLDMDLFLAACILTGVSFLLIGALKSRVTSRSAWSSIAETVLLGGTAAALAYYAGVLLKFLLV